MTDCTPIGPVDDRAVSFIRVKFHVSPRLHLRCQIFIMFLRSNLSRNRAAVMSQYECSPPCDIPEASVSHTG